MQPLKIGLFLSFLIVPCAMALGATPIDEIGIEAGDFTVTEGFVAGVPLIILDYDAAASESDPEADRASESGQGLREGLATLSFIGKTDGRNHPADTADVSVRVSVAFEDRDQADPALKGTLRLTSDQDGGLISLPGLPSGRIFQLQGSSRDKAMLRNAVARIVADRYKPGWAPRGYLCEVLVRHGSELKYEGVYLLSEPLEKGVPIAVNETMAQRKHIVLLESGSADALPPENVIYTSFPDADVDDVSAYLNVLHHLSSEAGAGSYFTALRNLDVGTFKDVFLITARLHNYGDPLLPFYLYRRPDGRVCADVRWDFDASFDNTEWPVMVFGGLDDAFPWIDRLTQGSRFVRDTGRSYQRLVNSSWEIDVLEHLIEDVVGQLGNGMQRDWLRWQNAYNAIFLLPALYENVEERIRQTATPTQETVKIKYLLRSSDLPLREFFSDLRRKDVEFTERNQKSRVAIETIGFSAAFFALVIFVRRRM